MEERVLIPGPAPNLTQDAEHIAAALPPVSILLTPTTTPTQLPTYLASLPVDFGEQAEQGDNYTWSERGLGPHRRPGPGHLGLHLGLQCRWRLQSVLDSGTDLTTQDQDSTDTFLAGALLGIAGGALVCSVPEFIRARRESGR